MTNCGSCSESCCASLPVTGGIFYRSYSNAGTGPANEAAPATINGLQLDKYEVTGPFKAPPTRQLDRGHPEAPAVEG